MEAPDLFELIDPDRLDALLRPVLEGGRAQLPALGRSMWPALRSGDSLVIEAVGAPRSGDILVVRAGERLVVHRLLREEGGRFCLKGDFNRAADPVVDRGAILGRVVEVLRNGRQLRLDGPPARLFGALMARVSSGTGEVADRTRSLRRRAVGAAVGPFGAVTRRFWPVAAPVVRLPPSGLKAYLMLAAARGEAVSAVRYWALGASLEDGSAGLFGAADAEGRLVASAECSSPLREGTPLPGTWLRNVWVSPLYRRRGLAAALLDAALAFARDLDLPALWLAVDPGNRPALQLCERRGFVREPGCSGPEWVLVEASPSPGATRVLVWRRP